MQTNALVFIEIGSDIWTGPFSKQSKNCVMRRLTFRLDYWRCYLVILWLIITTEPQKSQDTKPNGYFEFISGIK